MVPHPLRVRSVCHVPRSDQDQLRRNFFGSFSFEANFAFAKTGATEPVPENEKPALQRAFVRLCHFEEIWSGRRDSNPRPRPWQGRALPLSYTRIREIGGDHSPATGRAMPNALPECNSPREAFESAGQPA